MRRRRRLFISGLCAGVLFTGLFLLPHGTHSSATQKAARTQSILVHASPVGFDRDNPEQKRFGKLEWLGTLQLTSKFEDFGGFSGLAVDRSGEKLLAVTDEGMWLKADLVTRGGRIDGLSNARMGALKGLGGKTLTKKFNLDSEDMAMATPGALTGEAYISYERNHRIALHAVTEEGIGPAKRLLKLPPRAKSAKANRGIEGLAVLRGGPLKGALVAFTEEYLDRQGNHIGWLLRKSKSAMIRLKRLKGFAVTSLAGLPNGDLVVLERRFRFTEGVKMRLRRVKAAEIKPGALLQGDVLLETNQLREIDNMEGLAVHTDAQGRTILTIISDDNFNHTLQRTLLMQFAVAG